MKGKDLLNDVMVKDKTQYTAKVLEIGLCLADRASEKEPSQHAGF